MIKCRSLSTDEKYMSFALEEAKKALSEAEVPVGAVVVYEDKVIAKAHNMRETLQDPTAHAEVLALREASRKVGSWRLTGTTLYVTKEPCPMCAGAIVNARIKRLVYAVEDKKAGAESLFGLLSDRRLNHRVEIQKGVLEDRAKKILQLFFRQRRG